MGFRFRRGLQIGPARVNIGRRGISSVSFGRRGLTINVNRRGVRHTAGLPGSGMSLSTKRRTGCCLANALGAVLVLVASLGLACGLRRRT